MNGDEREGAGAEVEARDNARTSLLPEIDGFGVCDRETAVERDTRTSTARNSHGVGELCGEFAQMGEPWLIGFLRNHHMRHFLADQSEEGSVVGIGILDVRTHHLDLLARLCSRRVCQGQVPRRDHDKVEGERGQGV
jgi:hypothetical protein